jgi:hypothetical protein
VLLYGDLVKIMRQEKAIGLQEIVGVLIGAKMDISKY